MLIRPLMFRGAAAAVGLRPQDVYVTSLYTGNSTGRAITTGLDMLGAGGLVWSKTRGNAGTDHYLTDTQRGTSSILSANLTDPELISGTGVNGFLSNGYSLGGGRGNEFGETKVSWSFRRAPKFFDIVTYTGDGTSGRQIPHGLGIAPGMVIVKSRSNAEPWRVWHNGTTVGNYLVLNATDAQSTNGASSVFGNGTVAVAPSSTAFTVGNSIRVNGSGATYVAYLFAHDPDPVNGIVQCGSVTTDGAGNAAIALGWRPQFLLLKATTDGNQWILLDAARGWTAGSDKSLFANSSASEASFDAGEPNATGFSLSGFEASTPYVYLAIRAPI